MYQHKTTTRGSNRIWIIRKYSARECLDKLLTQDDTSVPSFKANRHWSIRMLAQSMVAVPLAFSTQPFNLEQREYINWVYRLAIYFQGCFIGDRYKAWLRGRHIAYTSAGNE